MNKDLLKALSKRIFSSAVTLFLLVSFLFILIRLSPGDPVQKYLSAEFSPERMKKVTSDFNLDKPVFNQYIIFVVNIFRGDLGISYNYRLPVLTVVMQFLSFTFVFAFLSFIIQIVVSFYLALKSIRNTGGLFAKVV